MTANFAFASAALAVACAIAVTNVAGAQNPPEPSGTSGNADIGKKLYTNYYCYACHGTEGQGGRDGARIAPNPPPFNTLRTYLRKPSGAMPPYTSKVVTDQELADIYAYLKTIQPPPALKDIPLLAQ
jgi:mono/diheme cytochrome c family protein